MAEGKKKGKVLRLHESNCGKRGEGKRVTTPPPHSRSREKKVWGETSVAISKARGKEERDWSCPHPKRKLRAAPKMRRTGPLGKEKKRRPGSPSGSRPIIAGEKKGWLEERKGEKKKGLGYPS